MCYISPSSPAFLCSLITFCIFPRELLAHVWLDLFLDTNREFFNCSDEQDLVLPAPFSFSTTGPEEYCSSLHAELTAG